MFELIEWAEQLIADDVECNKQGYDVASKVRRECAEEVLKMLKAYDVWTETEEGKEA